ncbi:nitroreductase family protein [Allopusillimonas ginsengisoli]|uniref:nitroreductase family protein n=1 Tax=Allopusillimonas ginsengisoli TaxID=453575 RepID=UPI001022207C|nr:nitroreductase family protein [Allopusillimonas ginsengisoli]TEA71899.1 nitroreductase [Allopusillimonas ginsengisoli]
MKSQCADLSALDRLTASRYTSRAYQSRTVDHETIRSIVSMASRSASWCNVQPWKLVITANEESTAHFRQALVDHAANSSAIDSDLPFPPGYQGVHAQRRRSAGLALYTALGITREDTERRASQAFENYQLFGAPHVAIVTVPACLGSYALVDAGGLVAYFLLSAQAHGVASTPQAALARHARFVRSYFDIPDTEHMVCGISFGYAEDSHPVNQFRTSRAPMDELVRFV